MKKTYMEPTLTVVNVKIDSLLGDASLPQNSTDEASVDDTGYYSNALSRENHSIWDEE